jgi:hypothetical protein
MPPRNGRELTLPDVFVTAEDLPNGSFLLTLQTGAISIRACVSAEEVAMLFNPEEAA